MNKLGSTTRHVGLFVLFLILLIVGYSLITANQEVPKNSGDIYQITQEATADLDKSTPTPSLNPYPAPTEEVRATFAPTPSLSPIILPPINDYPTPAPFQTMMLLYARTDRLGYYLKEIGDVEEKEFNRWWENKSVLGEFTFQVSPDGSKILYGVWNNQQLLEPNANAIWVTEPDGTNPQQLITATDEWFPENPIWSPDGLQIAFRKVYIEQPGLGGLITNKFEIWQMDLDGSNQHLVFADHQMGFGSISGKLMLFQWCNNGYIFFAPLTQDSALYALNPIEGKLYKLLDKTDPLDWKLSLSPDGERALVSSDLPYETIQMTGLSPVETDVDLSAVKWSGNGKKIVFAIYDSNDREKIKIKVKDIEKGEEKEIVKLQKIDKLLGFSPDGRFVLYKVKTEEGIYAWDLSNNTEILVIKADKAGDQGVIYFENWIPVK